MKKSIPLRAWRNSIGVLFLFSLTLTSFSQDCATRASIKPSESIRFPDSYERPGEGAVAKYNLAKMKPQLAIAENWVKSVLKNFTGARLAYSNDYYFAYTSGITKAFDQATGIRGSYSSKMRFYAYYCYEGRDQVFTEEESGSYIEVQFNNVFMSSLCKDVGVFTVNGKYAFTMFEKSRTDGRVDYYEQIAMSNEYDTIYKSKNEFIIIRNSDQPVFLPITRKEYLQQLMKDVEEYKIREINFAKAAYTPASEAANKAKFDEELKRIDHSKNYTAEQMAPYRKRFIETWETEKQKFDKRIAKTEKETEEAKQVIQEYQKKPQEWLQRSLQRFYGYSAYTGKGIREYLEKLDVYLYPKEEATRTFVASLNPSYFNKSLAAEVPQLIVVYLTKNNYPHMRKAAALIHRPGALKPLEALLAPGKPMAEQASISSASTYKLSYLPKPDKITTVPVPADMKPSIVSIMPVSNPAPLKKINFDLPVLSLKLKQLPAQPFTLETYRIYLLELLSKISTALNPEIKRKADDYLVNKKLTQSKDIGDAGFAAWVQNSPEASLYLYARAIANDPTDALTSNNFSAFLIMAGLPEKSIPILDFWNRQKPGEPALLANLGNAYYRLGDINTSMKYLQECVRKDSLHPTANKLLCMIYLKKGDVKKAEEHGTRSITACHDEEVISILRQLNGKIKVGEVMSRFPPLPQKEFPMLQRVKLPLMPSDLEDMASFTIELNAMIGSLKMTVAAIKAKHPVVNDDSQQQLLMASLKNGISATGMKAQYIIMDGLQTYQAEKTKATDFYNYHLIKLNGPYNNRIKAIQKKYNDQLKSLEGGEAGDEDKIQALELEECKELNKEKQAYLHQLSDLVNQYAQRQEYFSRKFFRDYANWAPYWLPETSSSFPSIEIEYLNDVLNILSAYKLVSKMDCSLLEPLPGKESHLLEWEDEYCSNFKGKIAMGPIKFFFTCNSWGIDGGEGIVGDVELKYRNDGSFENFTLGAGIGANFHLGKEGIIKTEAGISVKDFIKIGPDAATGKWVIKDVGVKAEIAGEAGIGSVSVEEKVIEATLAVNAGFEAGGLALSVLKF